jgi:GntR family transcriptional regulator, transcriptional repressor for pyruvate dehydrogenase complex
MPSIDTDRSALAASSAYNDQPGAPLVSARLSDRLAALLLAQIERGALKPGDRIPTEAQLASAHGVSRSVVREAVHQLKSRGMVHARQGSGVYVAATLPAQPLLFDASVLESVDAVVQVMELRRVLEGEIAALAAVRATRAQVATMKRALKGIDAAAKLGEDGVAQDMAFHRSIAQATGNPQFSRMLGFLEQYLREAMRVSKGNEARRDDFKRQSKEEHHVIVAAIEARDAAGARRAATAHLRKGAERLAKGGVIVVAQPGTKR